MDRNRMLGLAMGGLLAASALAPAIASAAVAGQDAGRQERGDDRGNHGPEGQPGRPAGPRGDQRGGVPPQAQAQPGGRPDGRPPDGYARDDRGQGYAGQGYAGQRGGPGQPGQQGDRYGQPGRPDGGQPPREGHRDGGYAGRPGGPGYGRPDGGYRGGQQYGNQQYGNQQYGGRPQGGPGGWNRGWRQDRRFDWSGYRRQNYGVFGLPRYAAPYGWRYGYRRFGIGVSLNAALFGRSYWIANPWAYRLPPAYGDLRWVRYYDDALLVDLDTGQVVDTVYGIFY